MNNWLKKIGRFLAVMTISISLPAMAQQHNSQAQPKQSTNKTSVLNEKDSRTSVATSSNQIDKEKISSQENSSDSSFVDRDGDGIQDGQEFRFRGKYRSNTRTEDPGQTQDSTQNQNRYRHGSSGQKGIP